jgi:hypothetical protein
MHRLAQEGCRTQRHQAAELAWCLDADEPDHRHRRKLRKRTERESGARCEIAVHQQYVAFRIELCRFEFHAVRSDVDGRDAEAAQRRHQGSRGRVLFCNDQGSAAAQVLDEASAAHDTRRSCFASGAPKRCEFQTK